MEHIVQKGDKVYYTSPHGKTENGVVKSLSESGEAAFVVYNCGGDWANYENYTGAHTKLSHLAPGWVEDKPKCDHRYLPTNTKYSPAHQMECCLCGHTIN